METLPYMGSEWTWIDCCPECLYHPYKAYMFHQTFLWYNDSIPVWFLLKFVADALVYARHVGRSYRTSQLPQALNHFQSHSRGVCNLTVTSRATIARNSYRSNFTQKLASYSSGNGVVLAWWPCHRSLRHRGHSSALPSEIPLYVLTSTLTRHHTYNLPQDQSVLHCQDIISLRSQPPIVVVLVTPLDLILRVIYETQQIVMLVTDAGRIYHGPLLTQRKEFLQHNVSTG